MKDELAEGRWDPSTPAVLFNLVRNPFQHGSLGITRSLGRLGVPVHTITYDDRAPAGLSRYVSRRFVADLEDASEDDVVRYLLGVGEQLGERAVIFPTDDVAALLVHVHADALRDSFLFPEQPRGLPLQLSAKREMYSLCLKYDVPTPDTRVPEDADHAISIARDLGYPVVIKGASSWTAHFESGPIEIFIASDERELRAQLPVIFGRAAPNVIFQEYIPGSPRSVWMFNGYFDSESECRFGITGRKIRQHPPHSGVTTLGICEMNEAVDELTTRFMKDVGYRGILDIGYRYDARSGEYKLLDVNPRVGGSFRLFVGRDGMDVVRAQYLDLTGQRVPTSVPDWGRKWLVDNYDPLSTYRYIRRNELTARDWLRSFRNTQEAAWYSSDDLRPFFAMSRRLLGRVAEKIRTGDGSPMASFPHTQDGSARSQQR
ncbi:MAG: carboxylate--amine ligase [Actinomycetota bacterium]|nr:carboxylate--amine ligase [Actinomycetota bacterium]